MRCFAAKVLKVDNPYLGTQLNACYLTHIKGL